MRAISALMREAVKADFIPNPSRSKGFLDGPKANDNSIREKAQQTLWWLVAMYAAIGGMAYTMLLALQKPDHM